MERCDGCKFYQPVQAVEGGDDCPELREFCRRFPPVVVTQNVAELILLATSGRKGELADAAEESGPGYFPSVFPEVCGNDWCGEYAPR